MEMINKSINWITESILNIRKSQLSISDKLALKTAVETMRKYKKITEIVEEWSEDEIDYEGHYGEDYMEKIQEVLKDGSN